MILREVADALAERGSATFSQIVADVRGDRGVVAECLDWWRRRGQVRVEEAPLTGGTCATHCSGCPLITACSTGDSAAQTEATVFVWQGASRKQGPAGRRPGVTS